MADYVGSRISLISNAEIRYEGVLYTVDVTESTVTLSEVKSYGTEDRQTDRPVAPRNEVYAYIIFRGSDIKSVKLVSAFDDPAILHHSAPPPQSMVPPTAMPPPQGPPPAPVGTGMPLKLPFGQPPPGPIPHAGPPPPMPSMSAPPPGPPPAGLGPPQQAAIPSPRGAVWDVPLLPGGYPPTAPPSAVGGLHSQVGVPGSLAEAAFHHPAAQESAPELPPPPAHSQPHGQRAPLFSAAVGAPKMPEKVPEDRGTQAAQPGKPIRRPQESRDQIQASTDHGKSGPKDDSAQRTKAGDESKAPGHRPKPQQPPLMGSPPTALTQSQPQQFLQYRQQGYDNRRQPDRRASGGGYYRNDSQGYNRGGGQQHGGYGGRGGMRYGHGGRGRGRGGLVGHLEPARQESRIKFADDFDFETSNAEFENVKSKLGDLSISSNGAAGDAPSAENGETAEAPSDQPALDTSKDGEDPDQKTFYNKERSFFDSISCEALERQTGTSGRPDWKNERKLNVETFGVSSVRRPGGYYRGYWRGGNAGGGPGQRGGMNRNSGYYGGGGGTGGGEGGRMGNGGGYYRGNYRGGGQRQGWGRGGGRPQMPQRSDQ